MSRVDLEPDSSAPKDMEDRYKKAAHILGTSLTEAILRMIHLPHSTTGALLGIKEKVIRIHDPAGIVAGHTGPFLERKLISPDKQK